MCESLAEHIATEEEMMLPAPNAHASCNLFERNMKRLHDSFG